MYKYKNAQENINGSIDCLIYINREWVPHTQDPALEYELHDSSDWSDIRACSKTEKNAYEADQKRINVNNKSLSYLKGTDWYVIRQLDLGTAIPEDVKVKRQEAREAIS